MFISINSLSVMKLDHIGSKTRSPGQILENPCVHFKGHSFYAIFMELCQNNTVHIMSKISFTPSDLVVVARLLTSLLTQSLILQAVCIAECEIKVELFVYNN